MQITPISEINKNVYNTKPKQVGFGNKYTSSSDFDGMNKLSLYAIWKFKSLWQAGRIQDMALGKRQTDQYLRMHRQQQ